MSRSVFLGIVLSAACFADTVTLRNGRTVEGTFLGGDSREIRVAVGNRIDTFLIADVSGIQFGAPASTATAATAVRQPAPTATASTGREIPAGSAVVVRMIDSIDSTRDRTGQTYRASLDEPLMVDGQTLVPSGVDAVVKLVDDKQAGKLTGRTELTLDLVSITINGRVVEVATGEVKQASESRTGQTARRTGGLAAAGAVIGAIAGGGKGAAVGAAAGAGAGAGVQILTKGPSVKIPSEARLEFTLQQPVRP
jgi:hypothetical protein